MKNEIEVKEIKDSLHVCLHCGNTDQSKIDCNCNGKHDDILVAGICLVCGESL